MKYIKKFEENSKINLEEFKDDIEKIFENEEWIVIKPKSFEALLYWSKDTEWKIVNVNDKYYNGSQYPKKYELHNRLYININKDNDKKYLFDFYRSYFYDEDEDDVYLSEFFDSNKVLLAVYGEILDSNNIVKENDEYWMVVEDYSYFEKFFKLDHKIRSTLIKEILGDDYHNEYNPSDFDLNENLTLDKDNLDLVKLLLIIEKIKNIDDYDYDIEDINDYDDVVNIIKSYDLDDLKSIIKGCICTAHEIADATAAWNNVINEIYDFFNLEQITNNSWRMYKNKLCLWIKFKSNTDAYLAKFIINNYDDSYSDSMIEYSPPYYGYDGKSKDIINSFNEELVDKILDYNSDNLTNIEFVEYFDIWKEMKKNNLKLSIDDSEFLNKLQMSVDMKKFNI